MKFIRAGFSPLLGKADARWQCLFSRERRGSVATWMFDVSGIALWVAALEQLLSHS